MGERRVGDVSRPNVTTTEAIQSLHSEAAQILQKGQQDLDLCFERWIRQHSQVVEALLPPGVDGDISPSLNASSLVQGDALPNMVGQPTPLEGGSPTTPAPRPDLSPRLGDCNTLSGSCELSTPLTGPKGKRLPTGYAGTSRQSGSHWRELMQKRNTPDLNKRNKKPHRADDFVIGKRRVEAEHNKTRLQEVVTNKYFEWFTIILVCVNALFLGIELAILCEDAKLRESLNQETIPSESAFFPACSYIFCIMFVIELCLRAAAEGMDFFGNSDRVWNAFDTLIVSVSVLEMVFNLTDTDSALGAVSALRVLRVVRVIKVLRIIRLLSFFRELRMMLYSLVNSFKSLCWAFLVLLMVFYVFGLTFTSGTYQACWVSDAAELDCGENSSELKYRFGSVSMSMISLFMAMSGGIDWGDLYLLIVPLGWVYAVIFLAFILFTIFAVVNVVTGVFVDSMMQSSTLDREVVISEMIKEKEDVTEKMHDLFMEMDSNHSELINLHEFEEHLDDKRAIAYFESMKLNVTDILTLFTLLDLDESGHVDYEEFILGCQRLKGEARSLDVAVIMYELRFLTKTFTCFADFVETQLNQAAAERVAAVTIGSVDRRKLAQGEAQEMPPMPGVENEDSVLRNAGETADLVSYEITNR